MPPSEKQDAECLVHFSCLTHAPLTLGRIDRVNSGALEATIFNLSDGLRTFLLNPHLVLRMARHEAIPWQKKSPHKTSRNRT